MKKLKIKLIKFLIKFILKFKNFKTSNNIIIFSDPRSGSTWLMEMLAIILPATINWEPLHVTEGVVPQRYNFGWRPYIPMENRNNAYYSLFNKIHKFKIHTKWTRSYILSLRKLIKSQFVLIKYVRANLLISFLLKNFNFKYKPILLLRHPVDIYQSQIKTFGYNNKISKYELPNAINSERYIAHIDYLNEMDSVLERCIALWCIDFQIISNQLEANKDKICIVFYSDLVKNPSKELEKVLNTLGLKKYVASINNVAFSKASSTAYKDNFKTSQEQQLYKNFNILDKNTKDKIQSIFDYFDFKLFSASSPLPNKKYIPNCIEKEFIY